MAADHLFEHTVKDILHDAIPITLSDALDLKMGDVIVYEKTPSKWKPWRKHQLVYSGININDVLTSPVTITTEEAVLYDNANFTRSISAHGSAGLDVDVKEALVSLGVNFDMDGERTLMSEFGQVKRMLWNLKEEVLKSTFRGSLNMDHPIVVPGSVLFVVTHLYQSAKFTLSLKTGISVDEKIGGSIGSTTESPDGHTSQSSSR